MTQRTQDFSRLCDDFLGNALDPKWVAETAAASVEMQGNAAALILTAAAGRAGLHLGDKLPFPIDDIDHFECRLKFTPAAGDHLDAGSNLVFGLAAAHNDDPDAIVASCGFKIVGGASLIACESNDGVINLDDVSTNRNLTKDVYKRFRITLTRGKNRIRFDAGGEQVATATVFNMSAYAGNLQPYVMLSGAVADRVDIDYIQVVARRH